MSSFHTKFGMNFILLILQCTAEKEKEILSAIKKAKVLPANSDEKNKKSESKHITDSTKELEPRKRSCKSNFIYINFMSLHVIQQALA